MRVKLIYYKLTKVWIIKVQIILTIILYLYIMQHQFCYFQVFSPPKKVMKTAVASPAKNDHKNEKARRVLQPLSTEQVKMRSPAVSGACNGPIITEELLISPDVSSPVIGLEKVDIRRRMMEEEAERRVPSSPQRPSNLEPAKGSSSPLRSGQRTPNKQVSLQNFFLQGKSPSRAQQPHSPVMQKTGSLSSPTVAKAKDKTEVLVADSPQSNSFTTPPFQSGNHSSPASVTSLSYSPSLNVSDARRKLSFIVADSPIPSSANQSEINFGINHGNATPSKPCPSSLSSRGDGLAFSSIASPMISSPRAGNREVKNKRRSVCLQQRPNPNTVEESSDEGDMLPENRSLGHSSGEEEENKENASTEEDKEDDKNDLIQEESDEENKENEQIVRITGGRNRIVSESESSEGSCFEVPESEDEGPDTDQEPRLNNKDPERLEKPLEQGGCNGIGRSRSSHTVISIENYR